MVIIIVMMSVIEGRCAIIVVVGHVCGGERQVERRTRIGQYDDRVKCHMMTISITRNVTDEGSHIRDEQHC